jgi:hypothetical protein
MATLTKRAAAAAISSVAAGAAVLLAGGSAQAAGPVTVTFNTVDPLQKASNNLPADQRLPVDLQSISQGFANYVARLNSSNSPTGFTNTGFSGLFAGADGTIVRTANGQNTLRFLYSQTSLTSSNPVGFTKTLSSTFDSFYLGGTCAVCGPLNVISGQTTSATGQYAGSNSANPTDGNYSIFSAMIPITYGVSGFTGTLQYLVSNNFTSEGQTLIPTDSVGQFTLTAVPGPLPVVGAAVAFGWSRKLRRRIAENRSV